MKAVMSEKLRAILRDPEGRRELQKVMSQTDAKKEGMEITVNGQKYKVQFVTSEPKVK